jgi:hypothetical protein
MVAMRKRLLATLVLGLVSLAACNFPSAEGTAVSGPDLVLTYAARTVEAQLTLAATGVQPPITPGAPGITATPPPPGSTAPPPTGGTATAAPTGAPTAGACDRGEFVKDITVPDNTTIEAGTEFTKTWQLRNSGTCTWNANYSIVFDHGEALGGPPSAPLTSGSVPPGETVDVSVVLRAPEAAGTYQGFWKLRNQAGQIFGLGSNGDKDFWVKIEVESPEDENGDDGSSVETGTYDFIARASSAAWVASGGGSDVTLTFGGADDDANGVAKLKEDITLENGTEAGKTLITHPKHNDDGKISGTFSEFTVQAGNRFKAKLGFLEDCGAGQVVFQLWYKEGSNLTLIKEWEKPCNGNLIFADEDLSGLSGKKVQFVLVALADGSPQDDLAIWGSARIELED